MAGSPQLEIDFSEPARLREHLVRCGVAPVAARLAELVMSHPESKHYPAERRATLVISSRKAAKLIHCSDRAVPQGAATLEQWGCFRELDRGRGKPPMYVLDIAAAASLETPEQRLAELVEDQPVRSSAHNCEPLRSSPRVIEGLDNLNPCSHPNRVHTTTRGAHFAPDRTTSHHASPAAARLPDYPWARRDGTTDAELIAAIRLGQLEVVWHLFEHALQMQWVADSEDVRVRFLTGCHHCATAKGLQRRMGRLVTFVKGNAMANVPSLDTSRMKQASEQWAAEQIRRQFRDPELEKFGRMMTREEDY